jgi:AcrR family transcriptional regulator
MARTIDYQRRDEIVQRAADHLLERGVVAVSLRELAAAVGVSSRMLVHHFDSREKLVSSAVREARSRQREAFEARLAPQPGRPYADVLTDAWRWLAADEARPYLRLFGQLYALAQAPDSPHAEFLRESVLDWLPTVEEGFAADGADPGVTRNESRPPSSATPPFSNLCIGRNSQRPQRHTAIVLGVAEQRPGRSV